MRISNELGSGHPRAAKYSVVVTTIEALMIGLVSAVIVIITKDHFAVIFTDSKEMQEAVSKLASLLGVTMILNSVQPVLSGKNFPNITYIDLSDLSELVHSSLSTDISISESALFQ